MESIGMMLYRIYREACAVRNCSVDGWDSLSKEEQQDWELTAERYVQALGHDTDNGLGFEKDLSRD